MSAAVAIFRRAPAPSIEHRRAVGAMVRAARVARNLSQEAVGDHIGTSSVMVHHVESGRSRMPRARIPVIAELLGLEVQAFEQPSLAAQDDDEAALLAAFRHLREDERRALLELVRP